MPPVVPPPNTPIFGARATEPPIPDSVDDLYAEWCATLKVADAIRLYRLGRHIMWRGLHREWPRAWDDAPHLEIYFKAWAHRTLAPTPAPDRP